MSESPKFINGLSGRNNQGASISSQLQWAPLVESYREEDIYNEAGLGREMNSMAKELKRMQGDASGLQLKLSSPRDSRGFEDWRRTQIKAWDVFKYLASLDGPYAARIARARAGGEPIAVSDFCRYQILHMGGEFLLRDLLQKQLLFSAQHGFADSIQPYTDLQRFSFGVSRVDIKVGGYSLEEVLAIDQRRDGSAAQYRFLMDTSLIAFQQSHEAVYKANRSGLFERYPNTTKYMIENLAAEVRAALLSTPDIVDEDIQNSFGIPREVAQKGRQFVQRIKNIVEGTYCNLLNPDSPEFTPLQEAVASYLRRGISEKLEALYNLGLDRYDHVYELYRAAEAFKAAGRQSDFYKLLTDSITEYTHSGLTGRVILHEEDAYEVLESGQVLSQDPIAVPAFGAVVASIFSKGSQRIFDDIDPAIVDSSGLVRPQSVAVVFDQNRPQRFAVSLHWESEWGELTDINLAFDSKRNMFDWNFLKDSTDPEMQLMARSALAATRRILAAINADISRAYQQRQQRGSMPVISKEGVVKHKRERATDEVYALRKQVREEARKHTTPARIDFTKALERINTPKKIVSPEPEVLSKMLGNISSTERGSVLEAIDRFNKEGVGKFTPKNAKDKNGKHLWTLSVGDTRVLVEEIGSTEGMWNFRIEDIDDRSRIYKKRKI